MAISHLEIYKNKNLHIYRQQQKQLKTSQPKSQPTDHRYCRMSQPR